MFFYVEKKSPYIRTSKTLCKHFRAKFPENSFWRVRVLEGDFGDKGTCACYFVVFFCLFFSLVKMDFHRSHERRNMFLESKLHFYSKSGEEKKIQKYQQKLKCQQKLESSKHRRSRRRGGRRHRDRRSRHSEKHSISNHSSKLLMNNTQSDNKDSSDVFDVVQTKPASDTPPTELTAYGITYLPKLFSPQDQHIIFQELEKASPLSSPITKKLFNTARKLSATDFDSVTVTQYDSIPVKHEPLSSEVFPTMIAFFGQPRVMQFQQNSSRQFLYIGSGSVVILSPDFIRSHEFTFLQDNMSRNQPTITATFRVSKSSA